MFDQILVSDIFFALNLLEIYFPIPGNGEEQVQLDIVI